MLSCPPAIRKMESRFSVPPISTKKKKKFQSGIHRDKIDDTAVRDGDCASGKLNSQNNNR